MGPIIKRHFSVCTVAGDTLTSYKKVQLLLGDDFTQANSYNVFDSNRHFVRKT